MYPSIKGDIRQIPSGYWRVFSRDEYGFKDERYFIFADGAFDYWRRMEQLAYYRIRARGLVPHLNVQTLDKKERIFVSKMVRKDWRGCTKKQYQYIVGIRERNPG
jgi:hypothetical protein